jgi:hypothetical protein
MSKVVINEPYKVAGQHLSVTVESSPIEVETDELELVRGPARAARDAIAADIRAIAAPVSKSTARRPDHVGSKLFNNTGHLANGLRVEEVHGGLAIVPPADRLQDERVRSRLTELVSSIRDPRPRIQKALEDAAASVVRIK